MRIQDAQIRFLRKVKGWSRLHRIRNDGIRVELNAYSIEERINEYRRRRKEHNDAKKEGRLLRQIRGLKPREREMLKQTFCLYRDVQKKTITLYVYNVHNNVTYVSIRRNMYVRTLNLFFISNSVSTGNLYINLAEL